MCSELGQTMGGAKSSESEISSFAAISFWPVGIGFVLGSNKRPPLGKCTGMRKGSRVPAGDGEVKSPSDFMTDFMLVLRFILGIGVEEDVASKGSRSASIFKRGFCCSAAEGSPERRCALVDWDMRQKFRVYPGK